MVQKLHYLRETPSQTAGPYVHIGLAPSSAGFEGYDVELGREIAGPKAKGERIRVEGVIIDGAGAPIKDAIIEIWQANSEGVYAHPESGGEGEKGKEEDGFRGFGRAICDFATGEWGFDTIKPGPVRGREGTAQSPHINLWIVARGINLGLYTRLYFEDEDNQNDPVLNMIEWERRRASLIAKRSGSGTYRFDIRLGTEDETVFFDI